MQQLSRRHACLHASVRSAASNGPMLRQLRLLVMRWHDTIRVHALADAHTQACSQCAELVQAYDKRKSEIELLVHRARQSLAVARAVLLDANGRAAATARRRCVASQLCLKLSVTGTSDSSRFLQKLACDMHMSSNICYAVQIQAWSNRLCLSGQHMHLANPSITRTSL